MAAADYTSLVQSLYISYFGRPADTLGLANFAARLDALHAPTTAQALASAYITDSALQTLINEFGNSDESNALYTGDSVAFVTAIYNNVLNRTPDFDGLVYWATEINSGRLTKANASLAILAGAQSNTSAQGMIDAAVVANKVAVATQFTVSIDTGAELSAYTGDAAAATARAMMLQVNESTTVAGFQATIDATLVSLVDASVPGATYTLTAGIDTVVGAGGGDTINSVVAGGLSALDSINGGNGKDTMNVSSTAAIAVPATASVTNVETVNMTSALDVTVDASGWTGLTALNVTGLGAMDVTGADTSAITVSTSSVAAAAVIVDGGTDVTVTASGVTTGTIDVGGNTAPTGAVSVTSSITGASAGGAINVTGGTTITVAQSTSNAGATASAVVVNGGEETTAVSVTHTTSVASTDNTVTVNDVWFGDADLTPGAIATVTANNYTTLAINASSVSTLNLTKGSGNVVIDNSDAVEAPVETLTLTLNGVTGGTLDDADVITAMNITTATAASTLANITDAALETITLAGDKKLTLTSIAGATGLTSIDASAATGGMTVGTQLLVGTAYAGGSGVDTITLGATTEAITTGDGSDIVTLAATTTALGTGGSIDAGDGTGDVLSFADADDATTVTASATFEGKVSGFESVKLAGAAGAGVTVNAANLDDISSVTVAVDLTQTLAVTNIATGGTVTYNAAQAAASTISVLNAATTTNDTFNVAVSAVAGVDVNSLTIASVESIAIASDDTATTSTGIEHIATLVAAAATSVTVAGDAGLTLTFTGTAVTTFDASGVTDGDVTWTSGALAAAADIKGGATADANIITFTAALDDVTYTGGSKIDTIVAANDNNNTFTLGNGVNTVDSGNGDNTVTGGTGVDDVGLGNGDNTVTTAGGNDIIVVGTGANVIDAGDGNDSITIGASAGTNTVNVGAGTDVIVLAGIQTAAGYYTSVTGMAAGDSINFAAVTTGASADGALGAKITLGGASSFANYLDAAAAGVGNVNALTNWFQFNGNTYVVVDNSAALTFQDGGDTVIELVGLVDLSTSTFATDVLTLV